MIAPEPFLASSTAVLYCATLYVRQCADQIEPAELSDLMNAIHNIPSYIRHWEDFYIEYLLQDLFSYEAKWAARGGPPLLRIFDQPTCWLTE